MGSARDLLGYESTSDTLLGGLRFHPVERLELGVDAAWNQADASLDPFAISVPAEFLAANPNMSYDFSGTPSYSDLDTTRLELATDARYRLQERFWVLAGYRYVDFQDDSPYLVDTDGTIDFYNLGLGWKF